MSKDQLSTMSFDRRRVLQGIAGGFAAAGSTTLFAPAVRAANKPIKIGYVSPKSGPLAAFAEAGVPMGMLFVRNQNGSHNPDEAMRIEDLCAAATLVAHLVAEA